MLPTTIITLACLWLCPTDPWIQINMWDSHPPQPIETRLKLDPEPKLRSAAAPQPSNPPADPPSSSPGVEQWRELVTTHFPPGEVERALCIMDHESGGNPSADNPSSTAAGLFQFLKSTWDTMVPLEVTGGSYSSGQVYQPEANIRAAAWLSTNVGWSQWSPYQRGACR